jgi:hypothetical protein
MKSQKPFSNFFLTRVKISGIFEPYRNSLFDTDNKNIQSLKNKPEIEFKGYLTVFTASNLESNL